MADDRPLRLAFDATFTLSPLTGIGTYAAEVLARYAADPALDVTAYAVAWRQHRHVAPHLPAGVRLPRRTDVLSPLHARAAWKRWDVPPIEAVTGPVDVVHGPNYVVPPARWAAQVVSVHDLTFLHYPQMSTVETLKYPALLRRAVERGAWVHVDTDAIGAEVVEVFAVPAERVVTVPLAHSCIPEADPAQGRALAGCDRYVLALGTVEPRKNLARLVAAWSRLADDDPDLGLVIAGTEGWGAPELDGALTVARHAERIARLGWVDAHQRAALLRGAAVLAYPSVYEGFGIPPLEAMSVGTPVVGSTDGAVRETCGDAAELVDPLDVDALADALGRVTSDAALADDLRRRGRERVAAFSWDRTASGLVDLYHRASSAR
jgi:glycosyltransferase involved in cell wall biosynthesis